MSSPEPKPLEVVEEAKPEVSGEGRGGGLRKMFWVAAFAIILLAIAALGTTGYLGQQEMRGRVDTLQADLETTRTALAKSEETLAGERARADGLQSTLGRVNELSQELAASLGELQALTGGGADAAETSDAAAITDEALAVEPLAPELAPEETLETEAGAVEVEAAPISEPQAAAPETARIETVLEAAPEAESAADETLSAVEESVAAPTNPIDAIETEAVESAVEVVTPVEAAVADALGDDAAPAAPELVIEVTESAVITDPISLPDTVPSILDGDNPLESSGALETQTPLEGELPLEAGELLGVREDQAANPAATDQIPSFGAEPPAPPVSEAPVDDSPSLWSRAVDGIRGLAPSD